MHPSPDILRSSVIGCVSKYEVTKKRCREGMFCSERDFSARKGSCYIISDLQQRQAKLKKVIRNFRRKKSHSKIWSEKFFSVPSYSAPSLRPYNQGIL